MLYASITKSTIPGNVSTHPLHYIIMHVLFIFQHIMLVALKECKLWGSGKGIKDAKTAQRKHIHDRVSCTSQI